MAENKGRRPAAAGDTEAGAGHTERNQRKMQVTEEGQPEQGADRVPAEDLTGTPLGSDPRE